MIAASLDLAKGLMLLNYGIDEARFTKPVYPGMTCHPGRTLNSGVHFLLRHLQLLLLGR